jgi:hypothetical protein
VAGLYRHQQGDVRRRGFEGRPGVRPIERCSEPAACRRVDQFRHQYRSSRSHSRHRKGGFGGDRAPPFSFRAESLGFTNLGLTIDYVRDLPFAGTVVHRTWAGANRRLVDKILAVYNRSIGWFYEQQNRAEAVKMMIEISRMQSADVEKSYEFLTKGTFFESTGKVSRAKLTALVAALQQLGDVPSGFEIERLVLPGVTQLTD